MKNSADMNILSTILKLPGMNQMLEKAPQTLSDFLQKLLEENQHKLNPDMQEEQIFYILFPQPDTNEFIISIVTADKDDKIIRSLKSIPLKDALSIIFNSTDNAD